MTQSKFIQRQAELLDHITRLAGDYSALIASLICEDSHPLHAHYTGEWQALTPEAQQKYATKEGTPSFFIFVKRKFYGTFMHNYAEGWNNQLIEHLHEQYNLASSVQ